MKINAVLSIVLKDWKNLNVYPQGSGLTKSDIFVQQLERTRFALVYFFNFHFFGFTIQFTGSQFPEQRSNLCLSGEAQSPNDWTTREFPVLHLCRLGNGLPNSSVGKESIYNAVDPSLISGSGIAAREGIGSPLQYS